MKKNIKVILLSLLLLVSGLFIFNSQPVQAAGTKAQANKLVKTYHLKKATVPKKFRGNWYDNNTKLRITSKHLYCDWIDNNKTVPLYKSNKAFNKKIETGKIPFNTHILLISSHKNNLSEGYPGGQGEVFLFGHKHGHQILYSTVGRYYRSRNLSRKYKDK